MTLHRAVAFTQIAHGNGRKQAGYMGRKRVELDHENRQDLDGNSQFCRNGYSHLIRRDFRECRFVLCGAKKTGGRIVVSDQTSGFSGR